MTEQSPLFNSRDHDDEINLREILGTLMGARWVIAAFAGAALALGVLYNQVATPIYQVNALVQVEDNKSGALGAVASELGDLFEGKTQAVTEIELIRSRMVLGKTVDDLSLDLFVQPKTFPVIGRLWADDAAKLDVGRFELSDAGIGQSFIVELSGNGEYALLDPEGELVSRGKVNETLTATWLGEPLGLFVRSATGQTGQRFVLSRMNRGAAINRLSANLSLSEKGRQSGIIQLMFKSSSRDLAVQVLNQIANNYVRQNVERKSAEAETTLAFIETQLPDVKKALEAAEVRFNDYRRRTGSVDITREGDLLLQQSVQAETSLVALQQERKSLLTRFTAEHPSVKALDTQIAALRSEQGRFSGDISRLPATQQELLRLTRDLQVNQELYTTLLNNAQQLKVVRGGTVGNVRVVDTAQRPLGPIEPRKSLILMLSLLLGLMAGVSFVFVQQMLKSGVKDANQIERKLGLSVLATIPVSEAQEKLFKQISKKGGRMSVLAHAAPDDLSIESIRSLRTSLHFALLDAPNNILMITGPSPQLGKSFVSVNLAAVIATAGQRVLLVDGDMRRGYLNEYFGMPRNGGLSELIAGQREVDQVIQASGLNGFDYVSTGELPPNPSELLLHPRFEAFLKDVSQRYDYVLVDSPPVMAVTDAAIIGRVAGATLLLARFAVTPLRELEHSAKRLQQAGVAVKGVLLNRVEASTGYSYGYQYAYAYKYGKRHD
ncbi:MAG: polysaccharide biosynthesis tyrosine autokinase [Moraxellaceae bacterium]|nr:polysaccharide biosynthesis tyrosine autokinase [Moraxellaceae bacterium]MDZ4386032.1 polysaccharide biosynthesis tyrosine autokinase [Moraxellaceae bacterium]